MVTTQGYCVQFLINPVSNSLQNNICMATYLPSHNPTGEIRTSSEVAFSYGLIQMNTPVLADQ